MQKNNSDKRRKKYGRILAALLILLFLLCSCAKPVGSLNKEESGSVRTPIVVASEKSKKSSSRITFWENAALPLPSSEENLQQGKHYNLYGNVESALPLEYVSIALSSSEGGKTTEYVVWFSKEENVRRYSLEKAENTLRGKSLNQTARFEDLTEGKYTYKLNAKAYETDETVLTGGEFLIESGDWYTLISNDFRGNYPAALAFFGDRDELIFKYKWAEGRNIVTDPEWVKKNIRSTPGVAGRKWKAHVKAVPYCEKAMKYLKNTYVRVSGDGYDSGIKKLYSLAVKNNGSYVSRFVSDRSFLSHHALGTAFDINAHLEPNKNRDENKAVIYKAVHDNLTYNGIKEEKGKTYYDFTYTGSFENMSAGVPDEIINYLLYELAFYRAGFGWGFYYRHSCDAMHFTLSEMDVSVHEKGIYALRKVFAYADE